jgi:quercetin dioxygenase-like cupin family protein
MHIDEIKHNQTTLAICVSQKQIQPGVKFFTPDANSLQAGQHSYPQGKVINPHRHCQVKMDRYETMQEVLYVTKGKLKVDIFTDEGNKLTEKVLTSGDMIILIAGGHGFQMLEDTEFVEVKQGPYNPDSKKSLNIQGLT